MNFQNHGIIKLCKGTVFGIKENCILQTLEFLGGVLNLKKSLSFLFDFIYFLLKKDEMIKVLKLDFRMD